MTELQPEAERLVQKWARTALGSYWRCDGCQELALYGEEIKHKADCQVLKDIASLKSARQAKVPIKVRPMLVSGMLATDENGPVILIDSEQDEYEQVVALWHEVLHLIGMTDEGAAERIAARLAGACDTVLRGLASNINAPISAAPFSEQQAVPEGWIPVGERLPTHIHSVLIWIVDDHQVEGEPYAEIGIYNATRGKWQMNFGDDDVDVEVTHWIPLPAAPSPVGHDG